MLAATEGLLDPVPLNEVDRAERLVCTAAMAAAPELRRRILAGDAMRTEDSAALIHAMKSSLIQQGWHGHP
jgi:hypothetical protein